MATFKAIVMAHCKRKDGTYNIRIRVTHNRRSRYISTQQYVTPEDLTRKLKIKNQAFIDANDDIIKQYRQICNRCGERLKQMDVNQVVEMLLLQKKNGDGFRLNFVEYGRKIARKIREEGRKGTANNYDIAVNAMVRYAKRDNIDISELSVKFLTGFVEWLKNRPSEGNRPKGTRAPSLYMGILRAIHNRAKKEFNDEEAGEINIPFSPFVKIEMPKESVPQKRAIAASDIFKIANLPYERETNKGRNRYNLAKDVFILSFGLVGMNTVDMFNCEQAEKGRITYNRTKTATRRDDKAKISVRIEPEMSALVNKYADTTKERVFNFRKLYSSPATFNAAVNKGLKQVGEKIGVKNLQFYAARHSWATIARNRCEVSKDDIDLALNHVNTNAKIADIYIEKDWSLIDIANRKVLDHVFLNSSTE